MRTLLLYRPNTEQERVALDYIRDFKMQTGKDLQTMDVDSPQGVDLCQLYGIVQYPAILVTDNEGHMQNLWSGDPMPLVNEVSYYVSGQAE